MVSLYMLGTAHSVANEEHHHTHFAIVGDRFGVLVDCGVCPRSRLQSLGIGRDFITDVIITHFHPDHVSGLPLFLMELWLTKRTLPIVIHASDPCINNIEEMLELYDWRSWPDMFPVEFHRIQEREGESVLERDGFRIEATPVRHYVPTIAVRVTTPEGGRVIYSSDTEPCAELARFAKNGSMLIHEATGFGAGHSSAAQAAETAKGAGVKELILIHYDPLGDLAELVRSAREVFSGKVTLAEDNLKIVLQP